MMNDARPLLRTIEANPSDDAPRLIFADWLEENGNEERAKRIRSFLDACNRGHEGNPGSFTTTFIRHLLGPTICEILLEENKASGGVHRQSLRVSGTRKVSVRSYPKNVWDGRTGEYRPRFRAFIQRGFVFKVECAIADWVKYGPRIVQEQPITNLYFPGLEPFFDEKAKVAPYTWSKTFHPGWYKPQQRSVVHGSIYKRLKNYQRSGMSQYGYDKMDDALKDLYDAAYDYAEHPEEPEPVLSDTKPSASMAKSVKQFGFVGDAFDEYDLVDNDDDYVWVMPSLTPTLDQLDKGTL